MARIVVIVGTPLQDSYCEAIGRAYQRGAESSGHEVRLFVLGDMNFEPVLREGYRHEQPLEPDLVAAREAFIAAGHVVLIFPLWCGDMPAIMKGFIERILQPDLLRIQRSGGRESWKLFKNKSAHVIMTMGMPGWFYRWYFGAHALKLMKRNILHFIGIKPVRETLFGMVSGVSGQKREQWLQRVELLGRTSQ